MGKLTTFGCLLKDGVKLVWVCIEVADRPRQHLRWPGRLWLLAHRGSEEARPRSRIQCLSIFKVPM